MKSLVFIFILLSMVLSPINAQYIEDADGEDWFSWSEEQQGWYLVGFYAAHTSIYWRTRYEMQVQGPVPLSQEQEDNLVDFFYIEPTVTELRAAVSVYYRSRGPLSERILDVINYVVGFY